MLNYEEKYCGATAGSVKNVVVDVNCGSIIDTFAAILVRIRKTT